MGRNEREKSRTPKEDKKEKDKKTGKDGKKNQEASESSEPKKQLVFPQEDTQTLSDASANMANPSDITSQEGEKPKKARFEEPSQTDDTKSVKSEASKSTTKSMALTTQRLEELTMDTPVRSDGTKTPLKMPAPAQRSRTSSAATSESADSENDPSSEKPDQEQEDEDMEEASLESLHKELRKIKKRQRDEQHSTEHKLHTMKQTLQEVSYDIETQGRLNAHLIYKKLQDDAKQASLSLSLEGFPKEASLSDRKAFVSWLLFEAENRDENYHVSYTTTRGEMSSIIIIYFSSGFLRNQMFQWFAEQYLRRRQKLYWWSAEAGRELNNEVRIRKTLSEDARLRGRFLKAAMEAINEAPTNVSDFFPAWGENAVKTKRDYEYLIWCHFSYATATCHIFITEELFETVQNYFEDKLEQISNNKNRGGKGKDGKGKSGKSAYASLDYAFDPKTPFWLKYICVHDWRNNLQVQQALKDEKTAQAYMEGSEG